MLFCRPLWVALLTVALLVGGGCATNQSLPSVPEKLGDNGLLVARLYVLGMKDIENASIQIDGRYLTSSMRDGYIVTALPPGEHHLKQIRAQGQLISSNVIEGTSPYRLVRGGGAPTFIYVPGGSYTVHYTTLDIDRKFKIEAGKTTNLGLIVYLPVTTDTAGKKSARVNNSREFHVITLDNTREINDFLNLNYPQLVASLTDRNIRLAPGTYLDSAKLPGLRRAIAYHESRGNNFVASGDKVLVYGRAGTIVAAEGKKTGYEVLDTGTLADIVGGGVHQETFSFLTSDAKLITWNGKTLEHGTIPGGRHMVTFKQAKDGGQVAVDSHFRIFSKALAADAWTLFDSAASSYPRNDFRLTTNGTGFFVVRGIKGIPDAVYYLPSASTPVRNIPLPQKRLPISSNDFNMPIAANDGLFVIFPGKRDFLFWAREKQNWQLQSVPAGDCKPMRIDRETGRLSVHCDGVENVSSDNGTTWSKNQV